MLVSVGVGVAVSVFLTSLEHAICHHRIKGHQRLHFDLVGVTGSVLQELKSALRMFPSPTPVVDSMKPPDRTPESDRAVTRTLVRF